MYFWVAIYLFLSVGGLVIFKAGANTASSMTMANGIIHMSVTPMAIVGVLCYIVNFPIYLHLVSKYDLGYMYLLLRGMPCILILAISVWFFHEKMTTCNMIGALAICAGVILMSIKK